MVADGIRGVTANPTIFARAIEGSDAYDEQFHDLVSPRRTVVPTRTGSSSSPTSRTRARCCDRRSTPVDGTDGFVSIEVAPELARDTGATVAAARDLHRAHRAPEPVRQDPGHRRRDPRDPASDDRRRSQHQCHAHLLAAPLRRGDRGVPRRPRDVRRAGGDPATVHSVASFFVSRVDTEVDRRLDAIGTDEARRPARPRRNRAGQARLPAVPRAVLRRSLGAARRARRARAATLWASTSTKNPDVPRHALRRQPDRPRHRQHAARGRPSPRSRTTAGWPAPSTPTSTTRTTSCADSPPSASTWTTSAPPSKTNGVARFHESFQDVLGALDAKARQLASR